MCDQDFSALIFGVAVRFGAGILYLESGDPSEPTGQVSFPLQLNPAVAELSHQGAFCIANEICSRPSNYQDVHTPPLQKNIHLEFTAIQICLVCCACLCH